MTNQVSDRESPVVQYVRIAEIKVASCGILKATLGSCVGVAMIDRRSGICALGHCLLPWAPTGVSPVDARFADHVIPNLLDAIGVARTHRKGLTVFMAGGARMVPDRDQQRVAVGDLNVATVKAALEAHRISFHVLETGGVQGFNLLLDCDAQVATCTRISTMDSKERS